MKHELKILPEYFEAVVSGEKRFEVRKDDRGYEVGDALLLREIGRSAEAPYTGREVEVDVLYIYRGEYCRSEYCIMSIALREQKKTVDAKSLAAVVEHIQQENRSIGREIKGNEKLSEVLIGKNKVLEETQSILNHLEEELIKLYGGGDEQ